MQGCRRPGTLLGALMLFTLPLTGACDLLNTPSGEPETVRVTIQSPDVGDAALVTSMEFILVPEAECAGEPGCPETVQLVRSDTTGPALPFDQTYSFDDRLQFFVEAFPFGEQTATLSMRVMSAPGDVAECT